MKGKIKRRLKTFEKIDLPYKTVIATFNPLRTDDLKPGLTQLIGKSYTWKAMYIPDEDEDYPNQWIMSAIGEDRKPSHEFHLSVPLCDLEIKQN